MFSIRTLSLSATGLALLLSSSLLLADPGNGKGNQNNGHSGKNNSISHAGILVPWSRLPFSSA